LKGNRDRAEFVEEFAFGCVKSSGLMGIGVERRRAMRRVGRPPTAAICVLAGLLCCLLAVAACTTAPPRVPYTQQEQAEAVIPGIPGARLWADDPAIAAGRRSVVARANLAQPTILALSGGGPDGAFGAGLLGGWTARGTRPQFTFRDRRERRRAARALRVPRAVL